MMIYSSGKENKINLGSSFFHLTQLLCQYLNAFQPINCLPEDEMTETAHLNNFH